MSDVALKASQEEFISAAMARHLDDAEFHARVYLACKALGLGGPQDGDLIRLVIVAAHAATQPLLTAPDVWCRSEGCIHRHYRSGPVPTHRLGSSCPDWQGA